MPLVFLSPIKKTYKSDLCSLSTLLGLVLLLAAILLPLFAAYATEDFWVRITEYTEQPLVDYFNNYMIYVSGYKDNFFDSSNSNLKAGYNTICNNNNEVQINCLIDGYLSINGGNENKDSITISYEFARIDGNNYLDVKIMFFLKYGLRKKVKLIMTPMIYINIPIFLEDQTSGKEIILNGDLELIQKSPIVGSTITSKIYYEEQPLDIKYKDSSPFDLLYYYNKYKNNNYTVKYKYEKIEKIKDDEQKNIKITIKMNIPKLQRVMYIQSIFESIKHAWMQYFYIFLPIYIGLYILFKFIIQNNIFYSQIKSDI